MVTVDECTTVHYPSGTLLTLIDLSRDNRSSASDEPSGFRRDVLASIAGALCVIIAMAALYFSGALFILGVYFLTLLNDALAE